MRLLHRMGMAIMAGCLIATVQATGASAAPSPGAGADGAGLDQAKQALTARIDGRLAELTALGSAVTAARQLSSGHRATLTALVAGDQAGLKQLRTKVAGETSAAAVKADAIEMINGYRVYILAAPQVRLTIAADLEAAAVTRMAPVADTLAAAIAKAKQGGKDTVQADAALVDLRGQLAAAGAAVAGRADALLAVRPGPDAAAITAKVDATRQSVRTARTSLKAAVADVKTIKNVLAG
jgi:hypothetical protein